MPPSPRAVCCFSDAKLRVNFLLRGRHLHRAFWADPVLCVDWHMYGWMAERDQRVLFS